MFVSHCPRHLCLVLLCAGTLTLGAPAGCGDEGVDTDVRSEPDCDENGENCCTHDDDVAIIVADQAAVEGASVDCAMDCLGEADALACSTPCVAEATGLSEVCSGCWAGMIDCSIVNCLAECLADAASSECRACQRVNCDAAFDACTGITE